jgi:hypothetical protein
MDLNPLTPNDLYRLRAVSPLKIKIPGKNMREKQTNTSIIHSVQLLRSQIATHHVTRHNTPIRIIDCSSIEQLSEGIMNAP